MMLCTLLCSMNIDTHFNLSSNCFGSEINEIPELCSFTIVKTHFSCFVFLHHSCVKLSHYSII
jgi:hypothetical protein